MTDYWDIKLRRDVASAWAGVILAEGELGLDLTSGLVHVGDGSTVFENLPRLALASSAIAFSLVFGG